jgi:2-polyprenyl-6-methoxyphenol hydroxylase-like FAD-dependent oxidoreductase
MRIIMDSETDVLIVGAGPTGLALAIALQKAGVRYLLIDKLEQAQGTSRAAVIHAHTLEALEPLGVSERLKAAGMLLPNFAIHERSKTLLSLCFSELPTVYPYMLMIPQNETERVLTSELETLGGRIFRGISATAISQNGNVAIAVLKSTVGLHQVRARYVVGADGMHSVVRAASDVSYDGGRYAQSFILADVKMQWAHGRGEVSLFFSTEGVMVVAPLPDGGFRIVAAIGDATEYSDKTAVQTLIDSRGPADKKSRIEDVVWSSNFKIHHRLVSKYRDGRMFVMGDAAHVHSPAGGQGMNTGLVDAVVLGKLLVRVLRDGEASEVLDQYGHLRRPAAKGVLQIAGRLTAAAMMRGSAGRQVRNAILRLIGASSPIRHKVAMQLSGLSRRRYSLMDGT